MAKSPNATEKVRETDGCSLDSYDNEYFIGGIMLNSNLFFLVPSVFIIILLNVITRRTNAKGKTRCIAKRPGILPPVDFLSVERNRFSYSLAYGCIAVSVTNMLLDKLQGRPGREMIDLEGNAFLKATGEIVTVLLITVMYLPFFLCLSTRARLLGSILGFLYGTLRCYYLVESATECPVDSESFLPYWPAMTDFPPVAIHFFLLARYLVIFVKEIRSRCCGKTYRAQQEKKEIGKIFACKENVQHVRNVFRGDKPELQPTSKLKRWIKKAVHIVYEKNPEFKYSVVILATVVVAGLMVCQLMVMIAGLGTQNFVQLKAFVASKKMLFVIYSGDDGLYNGIITALTVSIGIVIGCSLVSALITYFQMYRMLVSHRNHVMQLIKSKKKFLPEALPQPSRLVGRSLEFCGYQIAYFLWSFVVTAAFLTSFTLLVASASLLLPELMPPEVLKWIKDNVLMKVLRIAVMFVLALIVQRILALVVFKDRSIESKVINVDNRRCFLLVSFFFLFFNIVVGIMSCSLRVLKSMVLGLLFLARIDRPYLMKGFTSFDKAYLAYIGFLHLQVAHKHPVVLVFCQLLWDRQFNCKTHENSYDLKQVPRASHVALNRWFVAVNMIRNPSLRPYRKSTLLESEEPLDWSNEQEDAESSDDETQQLFVQRIETVV